MSIKLKNILIYSLTGILMVLSAILVNTGYLLKQKDANNIIVQKIVSTPSKLSQNQSNSGFIEIKSRVNNFWYKIQSNKWVIKEKDISGRTKNAFEYTLTHNSKKVFGMIISDDAEYEPQKISDFQLKLSNDKSTNLKIVHSSRTNINGINSIITKWQSESELGPMTYIGFFASGKNSSVRLVFATKSNDFDSLENDFIDFMSGISLK